MQMRRMSYSLPKLTRYTNLPLRPRGGRLQIRIASGAALSHLCVRVQMQTATVW